MIFRRFFAAFLAASLVAQPVLAAKLPPSAGSSVAISAPTNSGRTFRGRAPAGSTVTVSGTGVTSGTAVANGSGVWTFTFSQAPQANASVTATTGVTAFYTVPPLPPGALPDLVTNAIIAVAQSRADDAVAVVTNKTSGTTLTMSDASGRFKLTGNVVRVNRSLVVGTFPLVLTETQGPTVKQTTISMSVVNGLNAGPTFDRTARLNATVFEDKFTAYPNIYHPTLNPTGTYATFFNFGAATEAERYANVASRTLSYMNNSGNHEGQVYSDPNFTPTGGANPFEVTPGGGLVIKASLTPEAALPTVGYSPVVSGLLRTRAEIPPYGFYEARFLNELKPGYWSAAWLYEHVGEDGAEIDVHETGPIFGRFGGEWFFQNYIAAGDPNASFQGYQAPTRPDQAYRTVSVEWTPEVITFYVDGRAWRTTSATPDIIRQSMDLLVNLAVGWYPSPESPAGWSQQFVGPKKADGSFYTNSDAVGFDWQQMPFKHYVDYQRFYSLQGTAPPSETPPTFPLVFTSSMPANVTFTRNSEAYAESADGSTLTKFAAGVPARTNKGILIEPAGTRLTGTPTSGNGVAVSSPNLVLPDGSTGAATAFTEDTSFGFHRGVTAPTLTVGQTYSVSGYVKVPSGPRNIRVALGNTATDALFLMSGATVGTQAKGTSTISAKANGWRRIEQHGTLTSPDNYNEFKIEHIEGTNIAANYIVGDPANVTNAWGIQVETGAKATSPMPGGSRAASVMQFVMPAGKTSLLYTFDDGSTTTTTGLTPGATITVPTSFARSYVTQIDAP